MKKNECVMCDCQNPDTGDRRCGIERRQTKYDIFFPERRSGKDRRQTWDSRKNNTCTYENQDRLAN